jgi:hypothetical protein
MGEELEAVIKALFEVQRRAGAALLGEEWWSNLTAAGEQLQGEAGDSE